MYKRPFLVLPGGVCVPLEGDWRVEELRGEWYLLGHNSVTRFDSERAAATRLAQLTGANEPDVVMGVALESELALVLDLGLELEPDENPRIS
jgi:hypothetical protein